MRGKDWVLVRDRIRIKIKIRIRVRVGVTFSVRVYHWIVAGANVVHSNQELK